MDAEAKLRQLGRWVQEAEFGDESVWLSLLFRVRARLAPGGALGEDIARLFGLLAAGNQRAVIETRRTFASIAARPRELMLAELATPGARPPVVLLPTDDPVAGSLVISLPMAADLLAYFELPQALRELLTASLRASRRGSPQEHGAPEHAGADTHALR